MLQGNEMARHVSRILKCENQWIFHQTFFPSSKALLPLNKGPWYQHVVLTTTATPRQTQVKEFTTREDLSTEASECQKVHCFPKLEKKQLFLVQ